MSLGVVIKGPEGVVLAADSRVTLLGRRGGNSINSFAVNFDNATKLLSFSEPHNFVAAVTYGDAVIGNRTAHSFIPEFELGLKGEKRLNVEEFAKRISGFFVDRWDEAVKNQLIPDSYDGPGMAFIISGYDEDAAYGKVFLFNVPKHPELEQRNPGENEFGVTWGGQLEIVNRLIHGYDPNLPTILQQSLNLNDEQIHQVIQSLRPRMEFPIPYQVLPLQDCIDLATFIIRSTISMQNFGMGIRGVGGTIEVAVITRTDGLKFVQRKALHGERPI